MRIRRILRLAICIALVLLSASCATTEHRIAFIQYGLESGPSQTQAKSDVEITLKVIRPSEMYQFPELFAFRLEDFPLYNRYSGLRVMYPIGPLGKSWEHPLSTSDFSQQVMLCRVKVRNGTPHILRMKDARIYLIIEGQEPVPALSFNELLEQVDYFEAETNGYLARSSGLLTTQIPPGFFMALLLSRKNAFRLINDLRTEILPGFTYTGMLAFPATPNTYAAATISFFDITTKVDSIRFDNAKGTHRDKAKGTHLCSVIVGPVGSMGKPEAFPCCGRNPHWLRVVTTAGRFTGLSPSFRLIP